MLGRAYPGYLDCRRDEALAAVPAEPPDLTFRDTLLVGHQKDPGFLEVGLGGIWNRFDCRFWRCLYLFCNHSRSILLRLHIPEDPAIAGMPRDGHPGGRRTLEFPAILQFVA